MIKIESFLSDLKPLSDYVKIATFTDETNQIDGIVYPEICKDIPENITAEILEKLTKIFGRDITDPLIFMRKSQDGVYCPNEVHADNSMGKYALFIYINEHENSGTSFQAHTNTGISYAPALPEFVDIVALDSNNRDAWTELDFVEAKENRAVIFDSAKLHRSEPPGGVGIGETARVVLICFFGCAK